MLTRVESRCLLKTLLILTLIGWMLAAGSVIIMYIFGYVGFLMTSSNATLCSTYMTFKIQTNNTYIYTITFFGNVVGLLCGVLMWIIVLVRVLQSQPFQETDHVLFTFFNFYNIVVFYVLLSMALLGIMMPVGYFSTLVVQKGIKCLAWIQSDWLLIGGFSVGSLIAYLLAWIYNLKLFSKYSHLLDKTDQSLTHHQLPQQNLQQCKNMVQLFDIMLNKNKKQIELTSKLQREQQKQKQALKELLIASPYKDNCLARERERLNTMTYEEYRRMNVQEEMKSQQKVMQQQSPHLKQRKKKNIQQNNQHQPKENNPASKKLSQIALSPDDPHFNDIFKSSDEEQKKSDQINQMQPIIEQFSQEKSQQLNKIMYAANYSPITQEDRRRYEQYKRQEAKRMKSEVYQNRHPQNMTGGRSKTLLQKVITKYKRPLRNQQTYTTNITSPPTIKSIQPSFFSPEGQAVLQIQLKQQKVSITKQKKKDNISPIHLHKHIDKQPELYFHQSRIQNSTRKQGKLFMEQYSLLENNGSILGSLPSMGRLPEERESGSAMKRFKFKKELSNITVRNNQALIQYLRNCKYH